MLSYDPHDCSHLTIVIFGLSVLGRERPAAISIEIKSIDDTSNFDEFPESDILKPTGNTTNTASCCLTNALFTPQLWGDVYKSGWRTWRRTSVLRKYFRC